MSGKESVRMNDKKEPLKLESGKAETLKLVSTEPFWNGTDNYGKPKYGFKIIHISGADAMFVSDKVKLIIDTSNVQANQNFTILLDQAKNAEGQPINFWTLDKMDGNGSKTSNQWAEFDSPEAVIDTPAPSTEGPASTRHENRHENLFDVADQIQALEIRITKLESKLNEKNTTTAEVSSGDVPF